MSKKYKKSKESHRERDRERSKKKRKKEKKKKKDHEKKEKLKELIVHETKEKAREMIGPVLSEATPQSAASSAFRPMTKEEWEKQQSVIRRVLDPETGRNRLIKGDGEILEEPVSKSRHREINKKATASDGSYFQAQLQQKCKK